MHTYDEKTVMSPKRVRKYLSIELMILGNLQLKSKYLFSVVIQL